MEKKRICRQRNKGLVIENVKKCFVPRCEKGAASAHLDFKKERLTATFGRPTRLSTRRFRGRGREIVPCASVDLGEALQVGVVAAGLPSGVDVEMEDAPADEEAEPELARADQVSEVGDLEEIPEFLCPEVEQDEELSEMNEADADDDYYDDDCDDDDGAGYE